MEGSGRGLAAWLAASLAACALILAGSGCGGGDPDAASARGAIHTTNPERTFAPLVELAADEPWRPMSVRWFLDRAVFGFAEDDGCVDRVIAVGRTMPERQDEVTDWIFPMGLGRGASYFRNPHDASCENDFDRKFYADQLTRPHDPGPRIEGIRPGEGFYLDLEDAARGGPATGEPAVPAYVERSDEGGGRVRLTYWTLFGMHAAPGVRAHEGDWERVDVLLQEAGADRYQPLAVQVLTVDATTLDARASLTGDHLSDTGWGAARKVGGTHPVVEAERGTHTMAVALRGRGCRGCRGCARLATWRSLAKASAQPWYGFGGSWGEPGATSATTGPLGPRGRWPDAEGEAAEPSDAAARL